MTEYLRVNGCENLVRDVNTGAILNCSESDYLNYRKKINASMQMKSKLQEQEAEISQLKIDIAEIKSMLHQLLQAK